KRPGSDAVCYTKPLDSLKNWNDRFFWVDAFACLASFPWNTSKGVPKDHFPKSFEFNAEHFATLVALPAPFHKYPEQFLCLVGISRYYTLDEDAYPEFLEIDLLSFIRTAATTKVIVAERQRVEDEPRLLESTVGRVVPLLPIAPARAFSELEAIVDKLFDEGASGDGLGTEIQPVVATTDTIVEDVAPLQPRHQRKRKTVVADAGRPSHPPKKGEPLLTLPFVTSSVSATPELEDKSHADSVTGLNLRTIGAPQRFVISLDSSHHFGANIAEAEVDSIVMSSAPAIATVTTVTAAIDADATAGRAHVAPFMVVISLLVMLDEFAPLKFFASVREMDHDQLFTEFNVGAARQISLNAEAKLLKVKDGEIESLKAQLLLKEAEAAEAIRLWAEVFKIEAAEKSLRGEVHELEISSAGLQEKVVAYEDFIGQLKKFQDKKMEEVNEKFDKLCADFVDMALHLEEKFYPHLLTTISGRRWLLTHGVELAVFKCLNSTKYLSALGAAISKAVGKGMQEGLSAGITHGAKGRKLVDVVAYNPSAKADYLSALQRL
nr:putative transposase (putative), gypsy type [Tanacetum cinerariifolium]